MASLIPGYNYDIFISYRQKDNKGDRWVSEFVEALKTELESTFKEEISVYFDINPHDGLLETHDVDATLKEKLNCLVFIPIISRTYCDPKSFAWEHEFKPFVEHASKDKFGLKVKLPNGNVTNRVLPVRIHDLDIADIKECESVLGGVLRGIEFIYKSAGVNRPLRSKEDKPQENLNKTLYRDQINKVALAIKEMLEALRPHENSQERELKEVLHASTTVRTGKKLRTILGTLLVIALIIAGYLYIPKLLPTSEVEKSIAVLPFINDSPDLENGYFINGLMDEMLNNLQKIREFTVLSRTSTMQFSGTNRPTIPEIAEKLNVNYIVEGSGQKYGNRFVLRVQLIAANNEKHLWGESFEQEIRETDDIFKIQRRIAEAIASELKTTITPEEKQIIGKIPTTNLTAYDFYQRGMEVYYSNPFPGNPQTWRRMELLLKKALEYDSTFARAYSGLAGVYSLNHWNDTESYFKENYLDSVIILTDKALSYDPHLDEAFYARAIYYNNTGDPEKAIIEFDKAIKYNPNNWEAYRRKGSWVYLRSLYYSDYVKGLECLHKAARLNHSGELVDILMELADAYTYQAGFPEIGKKYYYEAFKLHGDTMVYNAYLGLLEIQYGEFNKGIEKLLKVNTRYSINGWLAEMYFYQGKYKESLKYLMKVINAYKSSGNLGRGQGMLGYIYLQNGYKKDAEYWFNEQLRLSQGAIKFGRFYSTSFDNRNAYYDLAGIYAFRDEKDKALELLAKFDNCPVMPKAKVDDIKYNPLFNKIRNDPEFRNIVKIWESKYMAEHERVRKWLEEHGMLDNYIFSNPFFYYDYVHLEAAKKALDRLKN